MATSPARTQRERLREKERRAPCVPCLGVGADRYSRKDFMALVPLPGVSFLRALGAAGDLWLDHRFR